METIPLPTVELTGFSEAERQKALERFQLLRPHLEEGLRLAEIARHHHLTPRTLHRWVQCYRAHGLAGLARKQRADSGQRHFPPELVGLVEGLALRKPALTAALIHRKVTEAAQREGWRLPSYATVYAILQHLEPALVMLAHEGSKAYRETYDLLHRREAQRPNEIWQADHTALDLWVATEQGRAAKPWLTVILDDHSRAIAGYVLYFQAPSAMQTALALHQAVWRKADSRWHVCGIPDTFYTDHGSDFTSQHLEQVAAALSMQLVFSWPGQPRGRGKIERFFGTVNQMLLGGLPGYAPAGSGPPPPVEGLLSLPMLDEKMREFILAEYHVRPHSETHVPPQARWEAGGTLPRMTDSLEQLDLLLLTVAKARYVHQDGIHFQGLRYLDLTLAAYVGEEVIIRYDPRDLAEIRLFHQGRFLCRAVCPELAGQTLSIKDILQARAQRRRHLQKTLSHRTTLVEALLGEREARRSDVGEISALPLPETESPVQPIRVRLKRYENE